MSKRIVYIEAPIFEGSQSSGTELNYKKLKRNFRTHSIFKDYREIIKVNNLQDSYGTKNIDSVVTKCENIRVAVLEAFKKGLFPIVVGGDHSLAMASIAAGAEFYGREDYAVIYLDGHCDINTEKTSFTHNIHGMPLGSSLGLCETLQIGPLKKKIYGRNIFILGARSIDDPEMDIITTNGVHLFKNDVLQKESIDNILNYLSSLIGNKKVHISFDVDVLDSSVFASTGYIMENGLKKETVNNLLLVCFKKLNVVSFDIVEYNPLLDRADKDFKTVVELLRLVERCVL